MRALVSLFALLAVAVTGCRSLPTESTDVAVLLRARVAEGYVQPFRTGDIDRWVEVFADDALAYHDGPPPMKGKAAIRAFGELVQNNFTIKAFDVVVDEVRFRDDWALTGGRYSAHFVPRAADAYSAAAGPRQGKFLFVWERRDGVWRIIADMGNSTDPAPPR